MRLSQQEGCLFHFLLSHRDHSFVVEGVDPCLQGGESRLVLLFAQGVAPHQHTGLGSLQGVQSAEAVEHGQRGIHAVVVIEGAHVGIGIGLRVDGAAEVVLGSYAGIHRWQEIADGTQLRCLVVVEFQFGSLHLMVMLYGILHALLHRPRLRLDLNRTQRHRDTEGCT